MDARDREGTEPSRFVLRYRGAGEVPVADLARIRAHARVRVVDEAGPRMLLVQATEADIRTLHLPDWLVVPESHTPLPDPRKKPRERP